ncbi:MAG: response regulator [Chloroflexi bacterium]|nr:response regulator [Chloroflexota bacterium]
MTEKKTTVLLCESDPVQRDLIGLALRRLGLQVIIAQSQSEAGGLIARYSPALVLLDLFLPGGGGLDLIRDIKQKGAQSPGVIVVSALGFTEVVEQAVAAGARDFLVKPVNPDFLVERVQAALEMKP